MSEHASINEELDWKKAGRIVAGIDSGALNSKALILLDGKPYAFSQVRNRTVKESAVKAVNVLLDKCRMKLKDIQYVVATGCGRMQVPFASQTATDVVCGAAGAVRIWGPSVRTVLDAGGQSCKVIHCTDKGRATAFLWNDKCAAGIGRSMEVFADLVGKEVTEIGTIALQSDKFPKVSDFCAVYAQSEILDFVRNKVPVEQAIAAYHYGMAKRISTLVARAGVKKDFVIIGGLAKNPGITEWVEKLVKVNRLSPKPEWDPTYTTALGAALFADSFYRRQQSGTH
ncbi:MAG: benzoyl-CoA reductase, bzd-type, subunit Q [Deltaproteobacteria bacterium HGW-Deltaproteobacteria-15]|jgi:predicted CoA-substrate-specific enzyme activase|nr:MAG: benzoyl-CoA reductase, bzd-type, subunit Q [Deltaproteobacteria bacterium HGW-Deltaproteobacteria-15]